jgi:DNA-binding MarR family transcriptional regulator
MNQHTETPLIGAQLNAVMQTISGRVLAEIHRAGFNDIHPAQLSVLRNLWPQGRRITELANRAGITKASVIYLVDQLQQRGYVERVPDASDGRATLVQLSERGWLIHRVARAAIQQVQEELTQAVGKDEMEVFLSTLARLTSWLSKEEAARSNGPLKARARGRRHAGF